MIIKAMKIVIIKRVLNSTW